MPRITKKKVAIKKDIEAQTEIPATSSVTEHNDDYIEIKLPKLYIPKQIPSINTVKQVFKGQYAPIIIVVVFVIAYMLGLWTTKIQTTIQNTITTTATAQQTK